MCMYMCRLSFITAATHRHHQVKRSQDTHIEVLVTLSCGSRKATKYTWSVHRQDEDGESPLKLEAASVHDPTLFLPAASLPYGNYTVSLKVYCNVASPCHATRDQNVCMWFVSASDTRFCARSCRCMLVVPHLNCKHVVVHVIHSMFAAGTKFLTCMHAW